MKSVFELVAKHVEPSIKRSIVEALVEQGLPKAEIAKCLDISPSLVTRYLKKERGLHDFTRIPDVAERVRRLAGRIVYEKLCGNEAYMEIVKLVFHVLSRKYACSIHYLLDKSVNPATCHVCTELFKPM
ncbi:MAG: XRE family transcriptional regulator [Desulfurococcaceae archaeon]